MAAILDLLSLSDTKHRPFALPAGNWQLFRFDIHHREWEIRKVDMKNLDLIYRFKNDYLIDGNPDLIHYSKGVQVIAWRKVSV